MINRHRDEKAAPSAGPRAASLLRPSLDTIDPLATEDDRIRDVYAHRGDPGRYTRLDPSHLWMMQEVEREMLRALRRHGWGILDRARLLEVGCGGVFWLRQFVQWGGLPANIVGVDLVPERIEEARAHCAADVTLLCRSARELPFPDASFDVVLQSTMFTSVLHPVAKAQIAAEMLRVTAPGGVLLWYDFRVDNPRNPDVRGIGGAEVRRLFPGCRVELDAVTLAPPLARWLAPRSLLASHLLSMVPLLCTHYVGAIWRER